MQKTVQDIYAELRAAFGNRWTVLGIIIGTLVARYDWLTHELAARGIIDVIGIPDWVAGIVIFTAWTTGMALWHAVKLRRTVTPGFRLSFDPNGFGVVEAVERLVTPDTAKEFRAMYVRVQGDTVGPAAANNCSAFLTKLWYRAFGKNTHFVEIPLPQPIPLRDAPFDIFPKIPCLVDFVKGAQTQHGDKLLVVRNWPFVLREKLNPEGTYKFMVTVYGPGGSKEKSVEVDWTGKWDTLTASEVTSQS
jgi:hypothetical protein